MQWQNHQAKSSFVLGCQSPFFQRFRKETQKSFISLMCSLDLLWKLMMLSLRGFKQTLTFTNNYLFKQKNPTSVEKHVRHVLHDNWTTI